MSSIESSRVIFEAERQVPMHAHHATNTVAMIGLALGGVFGMAGTFVASPSLRASFWALDGVGLIIAAALLAVKYFRNGHDVVAELHFGRPRCFYVHSQAVPCRSSGAGIDCCGSLRGDLGKNLLGRAGVGYLITLAFFRVSIPGIHIRRVDLDAA
jgi:hypothetical protein